MEINKKIIGAFSFLAMVFFLFIFIAKNCEANNNQIEDSYFNEFSLRTKGKICNVVKGEGTLKYFITVKIESTNMTEYFIKSPLGVYFAVQSEEHLVFIDSFKGYEIGQEVCIGCNNNIIEVKTDDGRTILVKSPRQAKLYNVSQPNKEIIEILNRGCD